MSHAADSDDYEAILGPLTLPRYGRIEKPVMFLLESPGSSFGNGSCLEIDGVTKRIPTHHYYWAPDQGPWPRTEDDLSQNMYGPYFAYLMAKFGLTNVYITNVVKCGKTQKGAPKRFMAYSFRARPINDDTKVLKKCANKFLSREVAAHQPTLIVAFGGNARNALRRTKIDILGATVAQLLHPAARLSRSCLISRNNVTLMESLRSVGLLVSA